MKAEINFSIDTYRQIIDLQDYGHDEHVKWSDLTDDEKNEITDGLSEQTIVLTDGSDFVE